MSRRTMTSTGNGHSQPRGGKNASSRGSTLVPIIAVVAAVLLVGVAIFILGHSEGDIVDYSIDDSRAFYIAEGGLERMRGWLGDAQVDDPGVDPVGTEFVNEALGGGTYTVKVVGDTSGGSWLDAYRVVSTGDIDGVVRQVRTYMIPETFARYQWFVERGGWRWFLTGERFEGPVHVNHDLQIDGDPWFGGTVTAGGGLTMKTGSNPTFERGYELGVPEVSLPGDAYMNGVLRAAALAGGIYAAPLGGPAGSYYEVILGAPSDGWLTYEGFDAAGNSIAALETEELAASNSAAWFSEMIRIEGTLDGVLTIGVDGDAWITDDIVYKASTPGNGPDVDCDDVLGLVADGDVVIEYNLENQNDCELHGVMMSLEKEVLAEDYMHHPPRGDIIVYGGLIADKSIHLGQYEGTVCVSGYGRNFNYDGRMFLTPPPYFPMTGQFVIFSWEEVVPPEV